MDGAAISRGDTATETMAGGRGHAPCRKTASKAGTGLTALQIGDTFDCGERLGFVLGNKPGAAVLHDLGHRAAPPRDDRGAACHGLDHHEPERLGPVDRNERRHRIAEEILFLALIDLADKFDAIAVDERLDLFLEKMTLHARYF